LKIPPKFDFGLGFSGFDKIVFAMGSKYGKKICGVFKKKLYCLFIEVIFEGSCFELEKSVLVVKHNCTF
jgi:hypothetical protein